ncbi:hypothetical protein FOZ61_004063 [Perkinsus olseni]|uniref:Mei2-like C-terminal RNA recognition motif domain-containing protein n=1 Tax=Perkinsus olseni TaxID=32597 RepID=A0A7J6LM70_PEROL|nr:hypothetical protein FOZ61_004063 [Perkinsus olseni]
MVRGERACCPRRHWREPGGDSARRRRMNLVVGNDGLVVLSGGVSRWGDAYPSLKLGCGEGAGGRETEQWPDGLELLDVCFMSLPSRPAGRQNPEANYQGFVKRFSPESSCSDNSRYRGQPDQALLLGDSSYLLESDQMAQREAMDVMAGEAHEESEWSDIRPRDVTENFSRLVTLGPAFGFAATRQDSILGHQRSFPVIRASAKVPSVTKIDDGGDFWRSPWPGKRGELKVAQRGCHGGPSGLSSNFDDWDETTGGGPRRSTQSARRSDDIDDKKSSPKVANVWPNGFWCLLSPHRYSLALLREEIASFPGLNDSYDLLYLPADASKDANRGYAFINLKSVSHVYLFTSMLQNHEWRHYNAPRRTCQLCFAHIQGREDTLQHLTQERHPLYMLQQRRRHLDAAPELNLLYVAASSIPGESISSSFVLDQSARKRSGAVTMSTLLKRPYDVLDETMEGKERRVGMQSVASLLDSLDWDEVPSLNAMLEEECRGALGTVVKFRCMVQDVMNPEPYQPVIRDKGGSARCGRYREEQPREDAEEGALRWGRGEFEMRQVFRCMRVPGETSWATEQQANREVCRGVDAGSEVEAGTTQERMTCGKDSGKREAVVKVYDVKEMDRDAMRLHEVSVRVAWVVEIVGILDSVGAAESAPWESGGGGPLAPIKEEEHDEGLELSAGDGGGGLKEGMLCRIQALRFDSANDWNPAMPLNEAMSKELVTERVRGELIDHLSKCLRGDRLAAEYLLLHMVSRHVSGLGTGLAQDTGLIVGHWPLNISGFSKSVDGGSRGSGVRDVTACVESLLPRVMEMEVSVGKLNSERWIPTKNYDTDELDSGLLQIARRTYLILDETLLDTGRANVANLRALQLLIRDQKIRVQFGPSQIELPTEVNTLTLSASQSVSSVVGSATPVWKFLGGID